MRRVSTLAVATIAVACLSACGNDEPADPPNVGGSSSSADEPSPTTSESSPVATPAAKFDKSGHEVHRGSVSATTPAEKAVAEAWFDYWKVRLAAYGEAKVDARELGKVATGTAAQNVIGRVAELQAEGLHLEGDTRFSVSGIKIRGNVATMESCGANKGTDRNADGSSAEKLNPFFNYTGLLQRSGGTWVVSNAEFGGYEKCEAGRS